MKQAYEGGPQVGGVGLTEDELMSRLWREGEWGDKGLGGVEKDRKRLSFKRGSAF